MTEQLHDLPRTILNRKRYTGMVLLRSIQYWYCFIQHILPAFSNIPVMDIIIHRPAEADYLSTGAKGFKAYGTKAFIGRRV